MKRIILSAALFLGLAGMVLAQSPGVPMLAIPSPTGNEQIRVVNSGPQIANVTIRQLRDTGGYQLISQAASNIFTVQNNVSMVSLYGPTAGTATITLPAAPVDGQRIQFFTTAGLTTATFNPNTSQTINSAPTSIAANGSIEFFWNLSSQTWFRIQ